MRTTHSTLSTLQLIFLISFLNFTTLNPALASESNAHWPGASVCDDPNQGPSVLCVGGLFIELTDDTGTEVLAFSFDQGTTDNCTQPGDLTFGIRLAGSGGVPQPSLTISCPDGNGDLKLNGSPYLIEMWVWDEDMNSDFCVAPLTILDNVGACGAAWFITQLEESEILTEGNGNALMGKLEKCNLGAFANQVRAFVRVGKITEEEAEALIRGANATCLGNGLIQQQTENSQGTFAIQSPVILAKDPELKQNFPNPLSSYTIIPFFLPEASAIQLKIHDPYGREVLTLAEQEFPAGDNQVRLEGELLANGLYFYTLRSESSLRSLPLIVRK